MEFIVATLRGAHVTALASILGALMFILTVAPPAMREAREEVRCLSARLLRVARVSAVLALVSGILWLGLEAAVIAGADSVRMTLRALPVVALRTQFGQWLLLRLGLVLVLLLVLRPRHANIVIATLLAAAGLAVQPVLGHAGAIGGSAGTTLIVSEIIHLLAAGAWLGGLLPLFITIGVLPHGAAATACRYFTPIGLTAVLLLGGTAVVQVAEFIGGLSGLFGTGYGQIALAKLALFIVLLTLAALNRLALTERLAETKTGGARRQMRASIALEAVIGTIVIILAGFLASRTPATHEQPVWPFAWRPSLAVMADPDLRREVIGALVATGGGCACLLTAIVWRRASWLAITAAIATFLFAIPHLDLLFVPAFPTSFFTSPTEFAATAIAHGAKLFSANCAVCHGPEGRGDGPASRALPTPPADLTAEHFWAHRDGELYWYISHGIEAPDGSKAMPGFGGSLSNEAVWDLIDYLRANNAGGSMRTTSRWSHPVPVPQFDLACPDGSTIDLDDLRGHVLRILAGSGEEVAVPIPPTGVSLTTIVLLKTRDPAPTRGFCVASEPETWTAFAILSGIPSESLEGAQFLADQNSWLRTVWRPGDLRDLSNPEVLADAVRNIAAHPLAEEAGSVHAHQH